MGKCKIANILQTATSCKAKWSEILDWRGGGGGNLGSKCGGGGGAV